MEQNVIKAQKEAERARKWWAENRDRGRARLKARNDEIKAIIFGFYSNGSYVCECCAFSYYDLLVIDHINGGGNQQRKLLKVNSGTTFYRWLLKNQCPDGYQVLCWHCNVSKWNRGQCEIDHKEMKY